MVMSPHHAASQYGPLPGRASGKRRRGGLSHLAICGGQILNSKSYVDSFSELSPAAQPQSLVSAVLHKPFKTGTAGTDSQWEV